jgi:hypothetical protein
MTSPRRPARRRPRTTISSVIVLLAIAVGGYVVHSTGLLDESASTAQGPTTQSPTAASSDATVPRTDGDAPESTRASSPTVAEARAALATLPVKGSAPATGYDREGDFGSAWLDVDRNGCDTRDDILARDLAGIVRDGACTVESGTLVSPYTGERIAFTRGPTTSTAVQIDHVVALENAWRSGAQQLSQADRERLANDPANLYAVDRHSNEQKRSGDAATWLPADKSFRCTYVTHQVTVKATYHLWVVPAERAAIERILSAC